MPNPRFPCVTWDGQPLYGLLEATGPHRLIAPWAPFDRKIAPHTTPQPFVDLPEYNEISSFHKTKLEITGKIKAILRFCLLNSVQPRDLFSLRLQWELLQEGVTVQATMRLQLFDQKRRWIVHQTWLLIAEWVFPSCFASLNFYLLCWVGC